MYASLREKFSPEISDATVLDVAVKAREVGIKPGDAELHLQGDRVWVFSSQTPGFRFQADLAVSPPSVREGGLKIQVQHKVMRISPVPRPLLLPGFSSPVFYVAVH